jgi:hypothetical protein
LRKIRIREQINNFAINTSNFFEGVVMPLRGKCKGWEQSYKHFIYFEGKYKGWKSMVQPIIAFGGGV